MPRVVEFLFAWLLHNHLALAARIAGSDHLQLHEARAGPFKKSDRIAIVGAGPGGVHMASRLKQLGYTQTTLLERSDRVGGKSLTIYLNETGECVQKQDPETGKVDTTSCVAHEMGTCFLHNGYHTIRDLVDEYGLTQIVAPEGRAMFSHYAKDQYHSQTMQEFVTASIMDGIKKGTITVPVWAVTQKLKVLVALVSAVKRYNDLHEEIFGKVEFSIPERLSENNLRRIDMTFLEFLEKNDLHALSGFLMFAHAAQGYGYVTTIPAFYGLWWISPELLNGYVQMSFHQQLEKYLLFGTNPVSKISEAMMGSGVQDLVRWLVGGTADVVARTTTMLPEGYQKIWTTIAEKDALDVRFGVEILNIDRKLNDPTAPVKIKYRQDGKLVYEDYDFLIYTAPHVHAKKYVKDVTPEEERIFDSLNSFVLATTLYTSAPVVDYTDDTERPIMYSADKMSGPKADGSWYADRYDDIIFGEVYNPEVQVRVGYQFYENFCPTGEEMLCDSDRTPNQKSIMRTAPTVLEKFKEELEKQQVKDVTILRQFPWPYFHHFSGEAIQQGMPWDLVQLQGQHKTWWIGASASFESVHDVTNYNLMLLKMYLGARVESGRVS